MNAIDFDNSSKSQILFRPIRLFSLVQSSQSSPPESHIVRIGDTGCSVIRCHPLFNSVLPLNGIAIDSFPGAFDTPAPRGRKFTGVVNLYGGFHPPSPLPGNKYESLARGLLDFPELSRETVPTLRHPAERRRQYVLIFAGN